MKLGDYVGKGESVIQSVTVKRDKASGRDWTSGKLACTDYRLVYVAERKVTDISLDGITAIEFSPRTILNKDTFVGVSLLLVAVVKWIIIDSTAAIPNPLLFISVLLGFIALGYLWEGIVNRFSRLKIHTPTESYSFVSKDSSMGNIPHAVRKARL